MIKYTNKYTDKSFDIAKCRELCQRRWRQKKRETGRRMVCKSGFREWLMNCREEAAKSPRMADAISALRNVVVDISCLDYFH